MAIPIFWRLILGNAAILLLSVTACLYSAVQLGSLRNSARSALDRDQRMIGYQEMLADTFLSEFRDGGKYIITHTESRYETLRQFKDDFARYMRELKSLAQSEEITSLLARIERNHRQYEELFEQEVGYIRAKQNYAQSRYQQERGQILESVLAELERLKEQLRTGLRDKITGIDTAATTARRITMVAALVIMLLGTLFSLRISRSLTLSLKSLKRRTESSLSQDVDSQWKGTQFPEIRELADAFEQKEKALRTEAANSAGIIRQITDDLVPQLLSLQKRLQRMQEKTERPLSSQEQTLIDDAAQETERLIQFCGNLLGAPGEPGEAPSFQSETAWTGKQ